MADRQYLEQLIKRLADEGRLIEAGRVALRIAVMPPNVSAAQLDDMRMAYMAGAQHLFSSMVSMLDPGTEETDADLSRMDLINKELEAFAEEMRLKIGRPGGSG
jgi:hypothetical protein